MAGPVNVTAPNPVTNAEFTKALGRALHRPTVFPTPKLALHAMFGEEMVAEMLLAGQRVLPARADGVRLHLRPSRDRRCAPLRRRPVTPDGR